MFGLPFAIQMAQWAVDDKATAEGRQATSEEYQAAIKRVFDNYVEASTMHQQAITLASSVTRPRRWWDIFG